LLKNVNDDLRATLECADLSALCNRTDRGRRRYLTSARSAR